MEVEPRPSGPPNIRNFQNYREFLEAFYQFKKASRSFSYRQFAALAGLKSPNYLQLVIQGKRNLTETTAQRIGEKIKLSAKENQYFVAMVRLENALNEQEVRRCEKEKYISLKNLVTSELHDNQALVLEEWWHLLVRETIALSDFKPTGEWISERLQNVISPQEAERSLQVLQKAGFVQERTGQWKVSDPVLDTGLENFPHAKMQEVHSQILKAWSKNLKNLSAEGQELGVLNIPMKKSSLPALQEKIRRFQDEIIGWLENETSDGADEIVQLGTYLIRFTK